MRTRGRDAAWPKSVDEYAVGDELDGEALCESEYPGAEGVGEDEVLDRLLDGRGGDVDDVAAALAHEGERPAQRAYEAHAERVADLVTVAHQVANAVQPMLESIAKVQSVFAAHAQELARIGAVLHPLLKAIAEADKSVRQYSSEWPNHAGKGTYVWTNVAMDVAPAQAPPANDTEGLESQLETPAKFNTSCHRNTAPSDEFVTLQVEFPHLVVSLVIVGACLLTLVRLERPDWADHIEGWLTFAALWLAYYWRPR